MSADGRRLVLVTGTPRSGTTPVGDLLAAAPRAAALYEPLNAHVGDRRIARYFEVPGAGGFTDESCDELVAAVRELRLRLRPGLFPEDRGLRRAAKRVTGSRTLATYRRCRLHPRLRTIVWKDPFAVFLARRLAAAHDASVVVTVRPPEAVAASFKRLGWRFDVTDLVDRLGTAGAAYRNLVADSGVDGPAGNAAALWYVVNDSLLRAARDVPGIVIVNIDRLLADRVGAMRILYDRLDLAWTPAVERRVLGSGVGVGPARPVGARAHGGHRDPDAVNRYWTEVLTPAEAEAVSRLTGRLWRAVEASAL